MPSFRIPFSRPSRSPQELAYVEDALKGGWLHGDGPYTKRAHALLSQQLSGAKTLLTTSCTHALEMMAVLFDLQPGDEVVLPSFTFSSTANAPALRGVSIRFADIDPRTWSMELPQLEEAIGPRTKAVFIVEYGGVSRDIVRMVEACRSRGIRVAEDAAHALFASFDGRPFGTFADVGALSFHASKNITCGEGGALITRDEKLLERAHILREKGTDRAKFLRGEVDRYTWRDVGSSWLPSDLLAALLCAQLENSNVTQANRHRVWSIYRNALEPLVGKLGVELQEIPKAVQHPAHVFGVLVPKARRDEILKAMAERGVQCTSHYEPLHLAPEGRKLDKARVLPVTDDVAARMVRLPLFADMTSEMAEEVVGNFIDVLRSS
jgi:dTDP-4-amino-4,6-dideoxygalactose transaminase